MNKKLLIGLGVVAAAGVGYYLWKRKKDSETETKSNAKGGANITCPKGTYPCNSWLTWWRDSCCNETN